MRGTVIIILVYLVGVIAAYFAAIKYDSMLDPVYRSEGKSYKLLKYSWIAVLMYLFVMIDEIKR